MKSKSILFLLLAGGLLLPGIGQGAQTAQVIVADPSIRINTGHCNCGLGFIYSLSFSTFYTEDPAQANGELAPLPQPVAHSHWSYMILEDPGMWASTTYAELNLPLTDADGDGIPDFFEASNDVAATTDGIYFIDWGPGTLTVDWQRAAGSSRGSCYVTMHDKILGPMGPFNNTFQIVQYGGTLSYTPGASTVSGTISLAQAGNPDSQIHGPVQFVKSAADRFNALTVQAGSWTTSDDGSLTFTNSTFSRVGSSYRGSVQFDGASSVLNLSIVDTSDLDHDGIPDFQR
jgi:hypothetical protein